MKKHIWLLACLFVGSVNATVITNGSFETGDFSGWTIQDIATPPLAVQVNSAGVSRGFGFFDSAPTDGRFAALHGFDGFGPGTIRISQDITVTNQSTIAFDYRAAWDLTFDANNIIDRTFDVNIETAGGGANLANFNILIANAGTQILDSGDVFASVDLSGFVGQTVNLNFDWFIPQQTTGPAFFQLDNVRSTMAVSAPVGIMLLGIGLAGLGFMRKKLGNNS